MDPTFLSNQPLENLNEDNDLLELRGKAEAIQVLLENENTAQHFEMIALYGGWGTGKTTILNHLSTELEKGKFVYVPFEAWKHEKDDNIALSLVDAIAEKLGDKETTKELLKVAFVFLKGLIKATKVKLEMPGQPGLGVEFDNKEAVNVFDEYLNEQTSFLQKQKKFEEEFKKIEKKLLEKFNKEKIIVFVDDLDRCEPENTLILLSAIKLFFTYGTKMIFLCGVDKEAVAKAIKTKYQDVIKSEEYLEKIFDASFNVPEPQSFDRFISKYFSGDINGERIAYRLNEFFKALNFTTPRKVKKVLNKYEMLRLFKNNGGHNQKHLIPNIINGQEGDLLETIFALYFIILYEFYNDLFFEIEDIERKIFAYAELYKNDLEKVKSKTVRLEDIVPQIKDQYYPIDIKQTTFSGLTNRMVSSDPRIALAIERNLFTFLAPSNVNSFSYSDQTMPFITQFDTGRNKILVNFCKYIYNFKAIIFKAEERSEYKIGHLFAMCRTLL